VGSTFEQRAARIAGPCAHPKEVTISNEPATNTAAR
jgi:hypothetical protein